MSVRNRKPACCSIPRLMVLVFVCVRVRVPPHRVDLPKSTHASTRRYTNNIRTARRHERHTTRRDTSTQNTRREHTRQETHTHNTVSGLDTLVPERARKKKSRPPDLRRASLRPRRGGRPALGRVRMCLVIDPNAAMPAVGARGWAGAAKHEREPAVTTAASGPPARSVCRRRPGSCRA